MNYIESDPITPNPPDEMSNDISDVADDLPDTSEGALFGDPADTAGVLPDSYALVAPEGLTLDAETLAEADPIFRELGLDNAGAQKLVPVAAKFGERIAAQAAQAANQAILGEVVEQRKAWATAARNDPEIGGNRWNETLELSAKALDALGYPKGSSFRNFLTDSGLANHPEMIRAMRKVGALVAEDSDFVRGDAGAPIRAPREAILYPNDLKQEGTN